MNIYIVSYDIEIDRKRNKIAKILEDYGLRVQFSVFECFLTEERFRELVKKLQKAFGEGAGCDSIRIYSLCKNCVDKIEVMGLQKGVKDRLQQDTIVV